MILVTGGTGFIGSTLIRRLAAEEKPVRILLKPSSKSPKLPRNIPLEVAVSSLQDERGLKAALKDVDIVFHLATAERKGSRADLEGVDIQGTNNILNAADKTRIKRIFYISHIGADRASAYPVMKAKAIAEGLVKQSGLPFTILKSATVYGAGDQFTTTFIRLAKTIPFFFFMPGNGSARLQPIWVEDLVTCLGIALEDGNTIGRTIDVGGMEAYPYRDLMKIIFQQSEIRRRITPFSRPLLRFFALNLEQNTRRFPYSIFWLDYLATDHTCEPDSVSRQFGLIPSRFEKTIGYLNTREKLN